MCLCPFFEKYGLLGCETKESQTKRHANSEKSKSRLQLYHTFFSELVQIQMHLEEYSLCKIHYNQLIASDFLRQLLLNSNLPSTSNRHGKRKVSNKFAEEQAHTEPAVTVEIDVYNSLQANKQTNEVAVQASNETHEIGVKVEDLKKQLEYAYEYVIESWDHVQEINKINKELTEQNNAFKYKWENRYSNQIKRIDAIIQIANQERQSIYKDIESLILNRQRFSLNNLLNFTPNNCWLESLAVESEPLPKGLLFLAFDNEQHGQHNYLDRGHNTVIYHTVTSFIALNMNKNNRVQFTIAPWLCDSLIDKQYDKLYYIAPEMQSEHELELKLYLSSILEELVVEKNDKFNTIDMTIKNQKGTGSHSKWCKKCNTTNIDNKKRTCPNCNEKLDTLAVLQAESANELTQINTASQSKSLVIKSYTFTHEQNRPNFDCISITQQSNPEHNVIIPEMYVPDPLEYNPNSIDNVRKVLEYIQKIAEINQGERKWLPVTCDGVPYTLAQKIKKDFPWLILIPGALHEEMNMLKAFIELNWMIDIKQFASLQGYRTENQLGYFKKSATENPSVENYLDWARKQEDHIYKLKFEQAVINFRTGIRNNRPLLVSAARRIFALIWSGCRHPMYRLLEITYGEQLMRLNPKVKQCIELYSVISRSGYSNQHQGLDAILEKVNKYLKALIPPVPSQKHWKIAARNCMKFIKLRRTLFNMIGHADNESSGGRICPDYTLESQQFQVNLRKAGFLNPQDDNRTFKSLGGEHLLSEQLKDFSNLACERRIKLINETFKSSKSNSSPRPIPITAQEAAAAMDEKNMTKKELLAIINSLLNSINTSDRPSYRGLPQKTNAELLEILQSIRDLHNNQNELENEIESEN
ncbi:hypothetical protein C2G38_2188862 [Gigaspora rosea]|uniref:Uncharacterized protein n=1 Tax=Gigaspora rosea TaxID=44941 RepID=A0A397V4B7_9GLOM|nr:hypothetical protein C2G38_2188862 [Gigaspora rosea]